ncbi:MAG: hypothetical protein AAGA12_11500 [Pseudomonadota bacterium]
MIRALVLGTLICGLAACGGNRNPARNAESGVELPYRAKLSFGNDPRDIEINVDADGASVEDVRESVRHKATSYCLLKFGGSDTEWDIDPLTDDWAFTQNGDDLIFTGRCTIR